LCKEATGVESTMVNPEVMEHGGVFTDDKIDNLLMFYRQYLYMKNYQETNKSGKRVYNGIIFSNLLMKLKVKVTLGRGFYITNLYYYKLHYLFLMYFSEPFLMGDRSWLMAPKSFSRFFSTCDENVVTILSSSDLGQVLWLIVL
jgi:hypothetical protein